MKKLLLFIILCVAGITAKSQIGTYVQIGTSVDHHSWTQEAQIGAFSGKHQLGGIFETSRSYQVAPYYAGIAYQFSQPIGKTISFLANVETKVNLQRDNDIVLEPGIGLGFNITPIIQLQTGLSARLNKQLHHTTQQGQFDAALNFKF